jgi:hypothetical protein
MQGELPRNRTGKKSLFLFKILNWFYIIYDPGAREMRQRRDYWIGVRGYGQTLFLCQGTSELGVVVWISRPFLGLLRSGFPFNLLEASDRKVRCRDGHPAWTTHETLPVWMSWKESIANEIFILLSGWSVVRLLKKLPFHKFVPLDLAHGPWREDIKSSRKRFFFFRWYWGCFLICAMLHNSMFCFAKEGYLLGYCENKSVLPYVMCFLLIDY